MSIMDVAGEWSCPRPRKFSACRNPGKFIKGTLRSALVACTCSHGKRSTSGAWLWTNLHFALSQKRQSVRQEVATVEIYCCTGQHGGELVKAWDFRAKKDLIRKVKPRKARIFKAWCRHAYTGIVNKGFSWLIFPIHDLQLWKSGLQCVCEVFVWFGLPLWNDESMALGLRILQRPHEVKAPKKKVLETLLSFSLPGDLDSIEFNALACIRSRRPSDSWCFCLLQ